MPYDRIINLITQKGFSGAAGLLGLNTLFTADLQAEGWVGAGAVGCFLVMLAVVVEFLMWRESNQNFRERIGALEADRKRAESRLEQYDEAFIKHLSSGRIGGGEPA